MAPLATPLDEQLVRRSVEALLTHVKRNAAKDGKAQLLDESVPISVIIALKTIPDTNGRTKPYMMYEPHQPANCRARASLSPCWQLAPRRKSAALGFRARCSAL